MEIPGIGTFTQEGDYGDYYSDWISVPVLGDQQCRLVLENYDHDPNPEEFRTAIANFLSIQPAVLKAVESHIFQYYQDTHCWEPEDEEFVAIASPDQVWNHIRLDKHPRVQRRFGKDQAIYISLSCGCDWEDEHGLQIVFRNGLTVNKIGACDGHLSYADAYGKDAMEFVIYPFQD